MPDGEDWLLRPVLAGCIRYESLIDGTLDLADVATLNDALDVRDENRFRVEEYQNKAAEMRNRNAMNARR